MEDDRFLKDLREEPRPEFARSLRERLRAGEEREAARGFVFRPAFAAAAAVLVVVGAFSVPAVRVSAQALLDMFRVRNFTAVPFDATRMEKLRDLEGDHSLLLFEQQEIQKPTEQKAATVAAAAALAGAPVRTPDYLPDGYVAGPIEVNGEGRGRLIPDGAKLKAVLETLGLDDVSVPPGLDGQPIEVHLWPVVTQEWNHPKGGILHLVQSRSPEVAMRSGVDLTQLGELALRILGLEAAEAKRVARTIDWQNTLVVPVPIGASTFREVTVSGNKGLMVTVERKRGESEKSGKDGERRNRPGSVVMWSEGDQVFALSGSQHGLDLIQIAESLR